MRGGVPFWFPGDLGPRSAKSRSRITLESAVEMLPLVSVISLSFAARPIIRDAVRHQAPSMLVPIDPSMLAPIDPSMLAPEPAMTTMLLAKSEADELLEDFFGSVPIIVSGIVLGSFVSQYLKNLKPMKTALPDAIAEVLPELPELPSVPEEYEELASLAVIPAFTVVFVLASQTGVLGASAGILAKGLLDGWNVIAGLVLKGAYLKY